VAATDRCQIPFGKDPQEGALLQLAQGPANAYDVATIAADCDAAAFLE
jgi:hypothetical protein